MPDPTTPIEEIYFGGLLPEVVVRPKEVKGNWNDPMLDDSSYYNQRKRKEEIENFARQLFTEQRGSIQDRMQEMRDDLLNPFAYLPFLGEAMDIQSIGYHLDKGNYGDAALYTGFAALPGAAGPIVNRVKPYLRPVVNSLYTPTYTFIEKLKMPFLTEDAKRALVKEKVIKDAIDFTERAMSSPEYAKRYANMKGMTKGGVEADNASILKEMESKGLLSGSYSDKNMDLYVYRNHNISVPDRINKTLPVYEDRFNPIPKKTSVKNLIEDSRSSINYKPGAAKKGTYSPGKVQRTDVTHDQYINAEAGTPEDLLDLIVHEAMGHGKVSGGTSLTQKEREFARDVFKPKRAVGKEPKERIAKEKYWQERSREAYTRSEEEVIARADEIRAALNFEDPYAKITVKDLERYEDMVNKSTDLPGVHPEKGSSTKQFMDAIDKEKMANFMNKFYVAAPIIGVVGAASAKQENTKLQYGGEIEKAQNSTEIFQIPANLMQQHKNELKFVESANGVLMKNPTTSASGFYGQLFSEIENMPEMKGITRDKFIADTTLQNEIYDKRYTDQIPKIPGVARTLQYLYEKYEPQIKEKNYSPLDVAGIINLLGREGARQYFGPHLRDKKPLAKTNPQLFTSKNDTPDEYVEKMRSIRPDNLLDYNYDTHSFNFSPYTRPYKEGQSLYLNLKNKFQNGGSIDKYQNKGEVSQWRKNLATLNTNDGFDTPFSEIINTIISPYWNEKDENSDPAEANAFRKYVGVEQVGENLRFEPSPYKKDAFELKGYYEDFPEDLSMYSDEEIEAMGNIYMVNENPIKPYADFVFGRHSTKKVPTEDGGFYIEYTDRWDLDPEQFLKTGKNTEDRYPEYEDNLKNKILDYLGDKAEKFIFNPFDIYGRIYYDKEGKRIGDRPSTFQNGGEVLAEQPMQQELPYQEVISYPTERQPAADPRVLRFKSARDSYINLDNTPVPKTLSKKYNIWNSMYKSPKGLPINSYKDIYDIQEFFNSGDWKKGFELIEKYRKPSHPMLGEIDPETKVFTPSADNLNTNEEIADYIDINDIPVKFRTVERIPINPDGFAPGSATEFADKVIIPGNNITMKDMQEPILANGEVLMPGEEAQFNANYVVEEKLTKAQDGLTIDNTSVSLPPIFDTEELIKQAEYLNRIEQNQEAAKEFAKENPALVYSGKIPETGKIDYSVTDKRRIQGDYTGNPNLAFATGNTKGSSKAYMEDAFNTEVAAGLLFEGLPIAYRGGIKPAITKGKELAKDVVNNTYRINPFAFKPQEGMMYRGLGVEGFEDAIQSGVFRPKQQGYSEGRSISEIVSTPKQFGKTYYAPAKEFKVVENYGPEYLAEVPFANNKFARRYGSQNWSWSTGKQIPIQEGRILQKDWLRGYKPVDVDAAILKEYLPKNMLVSGYKPGSFVLGNYKNVLNEGKDIHDVRLKYHNNMFLDPDEINMLQRFGKGNKKNYEKAVTDDIIGKSYVADKEVQSKPFNPYELRDELMGVEQPKVEVPTKSNSIINNNDLVESPNIFKENPNYVTLKNLEIPSFYSKPFQRTENSRAADKWMEEWFYHPETKKRFIDYGGTEKEWEAILNTLENPLKSNYKWGKNQPGGVYSSMFDQASVPLDATVGVGVHENTHKTGLLLTQDNPILHRLWNDFTDAVRLTPSEAYPEIMRFRQLLGLKPGQKLGLEEMQKNLHLLSDGYMMNFKIKDPKKLLDIINKAPALLPPTVAIGAGNAGIKEKKNTPNFIDSPKLQYGKTLKAQDSLRVDNTRTSMPIDPRFLERVVQETVAKEEFEKLPKKSQERIILQQNINDPEFRNRNKGELYKGLTTKEEISNFMSDLGTEFAYGPRTLFTLESPTVEEKLRNRSVRKDDLGEVWRNRFNSILDGTTWFMGGELFGAGLGKAAEFSVPYILGAEEAAKKLTTPFKGVWNNYKSGQNWAKSNPTWRKDNAIFRTDNYPEIRIVRRDYKKDLRNKLIEEGKVTPTIKEKVERKVASTIDDLRTKGIIPLGEKEAAKIAKVQKKAFDEGVDITNAWFYPQEIGTQINPITGELDMISPNRLRPHIKTKIMGILNEALTGKELINQVSKPLSDMTPPIINAMMLGGRNPYSLNQSAFNFNRSISPLFNTNNLPMQEGFMPIYKEYLKGNLNAHEVKYLLSNFGAIRGVNFHGGGPSVTYLNKGNYLKNPKQIFKTASHETGHTGQKLGIESIEDALGIMQPLGQNPSTFYWRDAVSHIPEGYGYYIPNPISKIGRMAEEIMVPPNMSVKNYIWEASPLEVHSELMAHRADIINRLKKQGNLSTEEAVQWLQEHEWQKNLKLPMSRNKKTGVWEYRSGSQGLITPQNEYISKLRNRGFFKKGVTDTQIREFLKLFPAFTGAAVVGSAGIKD